MSARAVWSRREFPKRSPTTCPRACVCQGARHPESESQRPSEETQRGRRQSPGRALPGRRAQGPPTGWERAGEAAAAAGLPRASPSLAASARRGLRTRRRFPAQGSGESPRRPPLGAGSVGAASAASLSPGASGRRFGLSPPRHPPAPPAPAPRPRPRPGARLPCRPGSGEPAPAELRGSRGQHQPQPPRELLRPHHARTGHRDRGPSPAFRGLRVSSGAPRAGAHAWTRGSTDRASRRPKFVCVPPGPGFEGPSPR